MQLFRKRTDPLSGAFRLPWAGLLAALLAVALALHPSETYAQLDQLLQRLLTPPVHTPSYPYQPGYPPPGYQQRITQPYEPAPAYAPPPRPRPPGAARDVVDGPTIAHVQTMLNDLGYDAGAPDGSPGGRTCHGCTGLPA